MQVTCSLSGLGVQNFDNKVGNVDIRVDKDLAGPCIPVCRPNCRLSTGLLLTCTPSMKSQLVEILDLLVDLVAYMGVVIKVENFKAEMHFGH